MALMLANTQPRFRPLRLYHVETAENGHKAMFMSMNWGLVADIGKLLYIYYIIYKIFLSFLEKRKKID